MNTHRIFFIRNIRKRIKTVRRNIVRYDFLFTFAKQMNYNVKIIFILIVSVPVLDKTFTSEYVITYLAEVDSSVQVTEQSHCIAAFAFL